MACEVLANRIAMVLPSLLPGVDGTESLAFEEVNGGFCTAETVLSFV